MKRWILLLALVSSHAWAEKIAPIEDLSTEVEAEQMDVYEQKEMEATAKREQAEFAKQAKSLEKEADRLRDESKSISKRIASKRDVYDRTLKAAISAERAAKKAEGKRDKLKSELDALNARIEQAQKRLDAARELERNLNTELSAAKAERSRLSERERASNQQIKKIQGNIKKQRLALRK